MQGAKPNTALVLSLLVLVLAARRVTAVRRHRSVPSDNGNQLRVGCAGGGGFEWV